MKNKTEKFLNLCEVKIWKMELHCSKEIINFINEDITKLMVSFAFAYGRNKETDAKYFTAYKIDETEN